MDLGMGIEFNVAEKYVKRYKEFTDAYYNPKIRNIFMKGGAGAGKSKLVAQVLLQNMDRYKFLCVRKVGDTLKDSVHAEFVEAISERGLEPYGRGHISRPPEIRFDGINKTIYKGIQHEKDREKLKSVQGIDQSWIEEATELTKDDFDQIDLRVRSGNNNKMICTFNPINANSRLKTEVEDKRENWKSNSVWIEKTPFDNQFLPEGYLESLRKKKDTNPAYYKIYVENKRGQGLKGLIYKNYQAFDFDIEPDVIGLDFGYNDPTALTYLKVTDREKSDKKDLYIREKLYQTHMEANDIIKWLNDNDVPKNVLIIADNARPEMISAISGAGYMIEACNKGPNSVVEGIVKMQMYNLNLRGKNIIKEASTYCWKLDKNGEPLDVPVDGNDHALDGARYAVKDFYYINEDDSLDLVVG